MTFEELKEKALSLPYVPGVYIMRDKADEVIYVGKAKQLHNRVSQYFQDMDAHTPKTRIMVSKIHHFDVIVAASEFEALVLECSLIKRYMPKYNILLKDDKGYPYIRLDMKQPYPVMSMVNKVSSDGAVYYGPYGSRGVTQGIIDAIVAALQLPNCNKKFPRDIGKDRPCLHYHMNQCAGWCQSNMQQKDYYSRMEQVKQLLSGNYRKVAEDLRAQMLDAAERMEFELAASLRDWLNAVESLGQKQLVTAGTLADTDVIGYAQTGAKACLTVLHYSGGNLLDKEYEVFPAPEDQETALSSLVKQYYLSRGAAPKVILLPFALEDMELFSQVLEQRYGNVCKLKVPQRGDNVRLVSLAVKNALEEAERVTSKEEKQNATLRLLGKMLGMAAPLRIESFDISNISGTDIVASMVVYQDGKPKKSEYKRFRMEGLTNQDDYASMAQVVTRRFIHYQAGDAGFDQLPDLLLIDGGVTHAKVALDALNDLKIYVPIFGMVKDDRHRTRALVTPYGQEIGIDGQQSVFALIGNIQEETHRFAITYHRQLRSKRLRYSELDEIPGVGPKRKELLLKSFKSLQAMGMATLPELEQFLPRDAAMAVYRHFHPEQKEE